MPHAINGIGTMWIGKRSMEADGSYVVTEWIVLLHIPILPLRSFRVRPAGDELVSPGKFTGYLQVFKDQTFLAERVPFCWHQAGLIYFFEAIVAGTLALFVARGADKWCWAAAGLAVVLLAGVFYAAHRSGEHFFD